MLTIDPRIGSGDLYPKLKKLGVKCQLEKMEYGDAAIVGNGPKGMPVPVGVEIKALGDLLSCITDSRFIGHQLPGLLEAYRYVWLVVEGQYRCGEEGMLEVPMWSRKRGKKGSLVWRPPTYGTSKQWMFRDVEHWLMTMEVKAGINVRRTFNRTETLNFLRFLNSWWCVKKYEQHRAHLGYHDTSHKLAWTERRRIIRDVPAVELMAKEIPGIGWERAQSVAKRFKTPREMTNGTREEWTTISGIGAKIADGAVRFCQGAGGGGGGAVRRLW